MHLQRNCSYARLYNLFPGYSLLLEYSVVKVLQKSSFYLLFMVQLVVATVVVMFPGVSLFKLAVTTQTLNAMMLPLVFYYLISLTSNKKLMGEYTNNTFQKYFTIAATVVISLASVFTLAATFLQF